jgi:hypothetical protein
LCPVAGFTDPRIRCFHNRDFPCTKGQRYNVWGCAPNKVEKAIQFGLKPRVHLASTP